MAFAFLSSFSPSNSSSSSSSGRFISVLPLSNSSVTAANLAEHETVVCDRLSLRTRSLYANSQKRFCDWLRLRPNGLSIYFDVDDKLKVDAIDLPILKTYILELQNAKNLSYNTLSSARSAILALLKENKVNFSKEAESDFNTFFAEIHRRDATMRAQGDMLDVEGKLPITFTFFSQSLTNLQLGFLATCGAESFDAFLKILTFHDVIFEVRGHIGG